MKAILISLCFLCLQHSTNAQAGSGSIINDSLAYEVMNLGTDSLALSKIGINSLLLRQRSIPYNEYDLSFHLERAPDSVLNETDKLFFLNYSDTATYLWDCSRLSYTTCLPDSLMKVFFNDRENGWECFRERYGRQAQILYTAKPVFNPNKDACVIVSGVVAGWTAGGGGFSILKKINGQWKTVYTKNMWTH